MSASQRGESDQAYQREDIVTEDHSTFRREAMPSFSAVCADGEVRGC